MKKTGTETIEGMLTWKFKCLLCNYKFRATMPQKFYDEYTKCAMCNSKEFEKKVIK